MGIRKGPEAQGRARSHRRARQWRGELSRGLCAPQGSAPFGEGQALHTGHKPPRLEVTGTCQTYIDLHRHAAVRAALTGHPSVALRLMVAHAVVGSHLWTVRPEPQTARNEATRESVEACAAEAQFDAKRRVVLDALGFSLEEAIVTGVNGDGYRLVRFSCARSILPKMR